MKELQAEIDEWRKLEGADENSQIAEFIKQLKEKDALIVERDEKLEDLKNRNHLLLEEKLDLKKQLEKTEKRGNETNPSRMSVLNDSFQAASAGVTGASQAELDSAKDEVDKIKDQNSGLKSQIEALNAVNTKLTAKNEKFIADKKAALEREKDMFKPENAEGE